MFIRLHVQSLFFFMEAIPFCQLLNKVQLFRGAQHIFIYILNLLLAITCVYVLYVQVTVHRNKLRIKQPTKCINIQHLFCHKALHVSGIFCAPIIRSYLLYIRQLVRFMQAM